MNGPTLSNMRATYASQTWASTYINENPTRPGIQLWTVPEDGIYRIEANAPRGGVTYILANNNGAIARGDFLLSKNDVIQVLVGQTGATDFLATGAGGTFIATSNNIPLLVAGGGGGAGGVGGGRFMFEMGNANSGTSETCRRYDAIRMLHKIYTNFERHSSTSVILKASSV
jgi:hypothetical protein